MAAETGGAPQRERRRYIDQVKELRARRGDAENKRMAADLKEMKRCEQLVLKAITDEAMTVPEIAEATGLPTQQVFWWITGLRKYNLVVDQGKRGDYMKYRKKEDA